MTPTITVYYAAPRRRHTLRYGRLAALALNITLWAAIIYGLGRVL